jgi:hypothetical protein
MAKIDPGNPSASDAVEHDVIAIATTHETIV